MLARVARIMAQLNQSWDVLSTLTPAEYSSFRADLGSSSGFQSYQYRMIEFLLGNKNAVMHRSRTATAPTCSRPLDALNSRALALRRSDTAARAARIRGRSAGVSSATGATLHVVQRIGAAPHGSQVYRDTGQHWELYELAEKLVDLEDAFRQWRFRHATTVERIIGLQARHRRHLGRGLPAKRVLDVVLFPELWRARTEL